MGQRLVQVKEQQLVDTEVLLLELELDLAAPHVLVIDLLHVLKEVNRLQDMDREFPDHVALQLAVLLRHIVIDLLLDCVVVHHPPISLPILLLSIFGFKVAENYLLVRHWRCVGRYQLLKFVFAFFFLRVGVRVRGRAGAAPLVALIDLVLGTFCLTL